MPQKQVVITGVMTYIDTPPGQPPYPDHSLPPFPSHPIVVPPGGNWPQPPQPPLGIWGPTDPRPTHPIAGWNPGSGTWPQPPGPVDPGYSPPWAQVPGGGGGQPPYPSTGPGFPTHPIQLPPWAGGWQPRPDQGLPGGQPYPDNTLPMPQPPQMPQRPEFTPIPGQPEGQFQWFYSPVYGWVLGTPKKDNGEGGGAGGGGEQPVEPGGGDGGEAPGQQGY